MDKATYGTGGAIKTIKGRFEQKAKRYTSKDGREAVSDTQLLLKPTATDSTTVAIGLRDRITLPAGFSPNQPPIIQSMPVYDEAGLHHLEVLL